MNGLLLLFCDNENSFHYSIWHEWLVFVSIYGQNNVTTVRFDAT